MSMRFPLVAVAVGLVFVLGPGGELAVVRAGIAESAPPAGQLSVSGTAALTGAVTDAASGRPISGAVVTLAQPFGPIEQSVISDSAGRFVVLGLPAGQPYALSAERSGYHLARFGRDRPDRNGLVCCGPEIVLTEGQWLRDLSLAMWRLSTIGGQVFDNRGEPIVGVAVRALTEARVGGSDYLAGTTLAVTDDEGRYRLTDLDPGTYRVAIVGAQATVPESTPEGPAERAIGELDDGRAPASAVRTGLSSPAFDSSNGHRLVINSLSIAPPTSDGAAMMYRPVFYPEATSHQEAQPITLDFGSHRTGIDFHLRPVPTYRVSGSVQPAQSIDRSPLLRLVPADNERIGLGQEAATTSLARDGSFTFLGVPSGDYVLLAQWGVMELVSGRVEPRVPVPPGSPMTPPGMGSFPVAPGLEFLDRSGPGGAYWGREGVSVANADVDSVRLTLRPTVTLRGRVDVADGVAVPTSHRRFCVSAEPAAADPMLGRPRARADDGVPTAFTFDGLLPGVYLLRASCSRGLTMMSVTWRGRDVTDTGIDATTDVNVDEIVITMTDKTTRLQGTVQADAGPPRYMAVVVFPVDESLRTSYGWFPRRLRSVTTEADGAYAVSGLPPGDYFVLAVEGEHAASWLDPEFLELASARADRVTIEWDTPVTRNLTLDTGIGR